MEEFTTPYLGTEDDTIIGSTPSGGVIIENPFGQFVEFPDGSTYRYDANGDSI